MARKKRKVIDLNTLLQGLEATTTTTADNSEPAPPLATQSPNPIAPAPALAPQPTPQPANSITLNAEQNAAIEMFKNNKNGCLIGYAGTGKTTTVLEAVNQIQIELASLEHSESVDHLNLPPTYPPIVMVAYTGMAVSQLRKNVGSQWASHCYTIHKLIDYGPVQRLAPPTRQQVSEGANPTALIARTVMEPRRHAGNKLPFKVVIIDEISMVATQLFEELVEALAPDCRIYAIGDIAQLPPTFGKSSAPAIMKNWPVVELTKIYRQKDGSLIDNANRIRVQQPPIANDSFNVMAIDTEANKAQSQIMSYLKNSDYDPELDIILSPTNVGAVGQEMLNIFLRQHYNKTGNPLTKVQTMRNDLAFQVGDKVICTKNEANLGIYNGLLGEILEIRVNTGASGHDMTDLAAQRESVNDEIMLSALADIQAKQEALKEERKLTQFIGGKMVVVNDDLDDEGTASRQASHVISVKFRGIDEPVLLYTSSQVENLKLAWAITVHKSQGSGFRNVYLIMHNSAGALLNNELLYTAVTRAQVGVHLLTTKYAFRKALKTQRIVGRTLNEKIAAFIEANGESTIPNLPKNRLLTW